MSSKVLSFKFALNKNSFFVRTEKRVKEFLATTKSTAQDKFFLLLKFLRGGQQNKCNSQQGVLLMSGGKGIPMSTKII